MYVPLVNNVDGRVLSRARACSIAAVVLDYNQRHPGNPVWVIADDVYAGSYLSADLTPQPIGALPAMGEWTVTVVTPSKTVALPTARVAFATTTSPMMRAALAHYRTVFSFGRVSQYGELSGVAALCLARRAGSSTGTPSTATMWTGWRFARMALDSSGDRRQICPS